MAKFVAVDGEGLTRSDGQHDYVLLAASDGSAIEDWGRDGLSSIACLDYLLERKKANPQSELVGFSFGYDVNMILRDIPRNIARRLHENNSAAWVPVAGLQYFFTYIPNKWFAITRYHWGIRTVYEMVDGVRTAHDEGQWIRNAYAKVWDTFGFYQSSFLRAIEDWKVSTPEETAFISEMKLKRGGFTADEQVRIKEYCWRECALLVDLCTQLDEALVTANLETKQYHGAGAIANVLLHRERALNYLVQRPDNDYLWDAILRAYFGGRIETFVSGYIPEPVYSYDINSAYPAAIRHLPNLRQGRWIKLSAYDPSYEFALWRVEWKLKKDARLAPFPFRRDSNIYYQSVGAGWYHAPEVRAAVDCKMGVRVLEGIAFIPDTDERPFAWVEQIYRDRQEAKARGDKREKALKLGMNSLYGKFAQGVSGQNRPGRYQCYFFAGWITSYCRGIMLRAAAQHPEDVVAIATDGLFSLARHDVDIGKGLGQWEEKDAIDEGIMVVQPGLIISRYEALVRTRGVDKKSVVRENGEGFEIFKSAWEQLGVAAKVEVTDTRFITLGRALASSHNTAEMNKVWRRWKAEPRQISYFPERKRLQMSRAGWMPNDGWTRLYLFDGEPGELSGLYEKGMQVEHEVEPVEFIDSLRVLE